MIIAIVAPAAGIDRTTAMIAAAVADTITMDRASLGAMIHIQPAILNYVVGTIEITFIKGGKAAEIAIDMLDATKAEGIAARKNRSMIKGDNQTGATSCRCIV